MCNEEWDYKYCEYKGLEFYVCGYKGQLYFDVDYGDEFIVTVRIGGGYSMMMIEVAFGIGLATGMISIAILVAVFGYD